LSAVDNCGVSSLARSGGVANNSFVIVGTNWTDYTATDAAGNDVTCTVSIVVRDDEGPTILCPAPFAVSSSSSSCGSNVTYSAPSAFDNCPGSLVSRVDGPSSGGLFGLGRTNVSFVVEDAVVDLHIHLIGLGIETGAIAIAFSLTRLQVCEKINL
jgi:hypothetical protein